MVAHAAEQLPVPSGAGSEGPQYRLGASDCTFRSVLNKSLHLIKIFKLRILRNTNFLGPTTGYILRVHVRTTFVQLFIKKLAMYPENEPVFPPNPGFFVDFYSQGIKVYTYLGAEATDRSRVCFPA